MHILLALTLALFALFSATPIPAMPEPTAEASYKWGTARTEKGDLDGALTDYDEAIRLDPDSIDAYHNRGIAHMNQGAYEAAMADFQKYLDLGGGKKHNNQAMIARVIQELQKRLDSQR